jgi:hypothetical protein
MKSRRPRPVRWFESGFIVVPALRSIARILELAAGRGAGWVVLRRSVDGQAKPLLYVYRFSELETLRRERPAVAHVAAEDALELREVKASPESNDPVPPASTAVPGDPRWPSTQRIVHHGIDGRPDAIGEIEQDQVRDSGARRGKSGPRTATPSPSRGASDTGPAAGASAGVLVSSGPPPFDLGPMRSAGAPPGGGEPAAETVQVELSAQGPAEIKVGAEDGIDIQVALAGAVPALAHAVRADADAKPEEKIVALLSIQGDALAAVGAKLLRLDVPTAEKPSSQKAFAVRAAREGVAQVAVIFQQGGSELGTVAFRIRAVTAQPGDAKVTADATAAPRDRADDDVVLLLIEEKLLPGGGLCYNYKLVSDRLDWDHADFDSPPLKDEGGGAAANARRYVDGVYKRMTERVLANYDDVKAFAREVKAMGVDLSRQLFPDKLVRALWENRDKLGVVHVKSWEPYIPWEIVRLKHPDSGATDERFLAEYSLVRSLNGASRPSRLAFANWRYLAAEYPNGSEQPLTAERSLFTDVLARRDIKALPIKADPNEVYDALNRPDFDVLHIACHGKAAHEDIEQSMLIIGDRKVGAEIKPVILDPTTVREEAKLVERHPLVFLNACESGRIGRSLTAWGGWPRTFWDAGASVFVGTSWSVRDKPAREFCEAFYGALIDGQTVATATGAGRAAIKDKGDATWLAYKVYGRPTARRQ